MTSYIHLVITQVTYVHWHMINNFVLYMFNYCIYSTVYVLYMCLITVYTVHTTIKITPQWWLLFATVQVSDCYLLIWVKYAVLYSVTTSKAVWIIQPLKCFVAIVTANAITNTITEHSKEIFLIHWNYWTNFFSTIWLHWSKCTIWVNSHATYSRH